RDPAHRFQTAEEFQSELEKVATPAPSQPPDKPAPSPDKMKQSEQRQLSISQAQELFEKGELDAGRALVEDILKDIWERRIALEHSPSDVKMNPESEKEFLRWEENRSQQAMQLLKQAISSRKYEEIGQILRNFEEKSLLGTFAQQSASQTVDPKVAFKTAFENGKKLYDASKLEEAITAWKEACEIDSDNAIAKKCIVAAENRLKKEKQIRNEVKELLAQCSGNIMKKNFS